MAGPDPSRPEPDAVAAAVVAAVVLPCLPGQQGHAAVGLCGVCEAARHDVQTRLAAAIQAERTAAKAAASSSLRIRVDLAHELRLGQQAYDLVKGAFGRLRAAVALEGPAAGEMLHQRLLAAGLALDGHTPEACPTGEAGCARCCPSLVPWTRLSEFQQALLTATAEALFAELRRRAGLDVAGPAATAAGQRPADGEPAPGGR